MGKEHTLIGPKCSEETRKLGLRPELCGTGTKLGGANRFRVNGATLSAVFPSIPQTGTVTRTETVIHYSTGKREAKLGDTARLEDQVSFNLVPTADGKVITIK